MSRPRSRPAEPPEPDLPDDNQPFGPTDSWYDHSMTQAFARKARARQTELFNALLVAANNSPDPVVRGAASQYQESRITAALFVPKEMR